MTSDEIEKRIRTFITEELLVDLDDGLDRRTDLFTAGVIESRDYLRLLRFIQGDLGAEMTDEDLFTNVLVSIDGMVAFVRTKHAAGTGTAP